MYFIQHSDYLMPRVHQMRTDLAQFYNSTKPSLRLQYVTTTGDKVNFQMNGTDLLLRDLNIFCTTKANHRNMVEQMKQLAVQNNTAGASIYDLGNIMQSESLAELQTVLKRTEEKANEIRKEQQQHEQQMKEMELQQRDQEKKLELDVRTQEAEKDRRKDLLVAEIRSAGYGAMEDINQNLVSDYQDALSNIQKTEQYQSQMNLQQDKENNRGIQFNTKVNLEREKMMVQENIANKQVEIARVNKNRFDTKEKDKKKK